MKRVSVGLLAVEDKGINRKWFWRSLGTVVSLGQCLEPGLGWTVVEDYRGQDG